jgi:hypothetical protein
MSSVPTRSNPFRAMLERLKLRKNRDLGAVFQPFQRKPCPYTCARTRSLSFFSIKDRTVGTVSNILSVSMAWPFRPRSNRSNQGEKVWKAAEIAGSTNIAPSTLAAIAEETRQLSSTRSSRLNRRSLLLPRRLSRSSCGPRVFRLWTLQIGVENGASDQTRSSVSLIGGGA